MSEFTSQDITADCYPKCTYCLTNTNLIPQPIYICRTCNDNLCCCVGCSQYCHDGHDVEFFAHGKAYCDCGANSYGNGISCSLSLSSNIAARTILGNNNNVPITLDDDGRIGTTAATNLIINDFSIHEYNIINNDSINMIDKLKEECISLAQISKDTFWIHSNNNNPRNILEKYALDIFHYHTQNTTYNNEISGAEYWVQIKHNEADEGIDLHYDKDEEIASMFELGIFPQISTVTYLSNSMKTPTIVYQKTNDDNNISEEILNCWLSFPCLNKHISFDGRYLHGAPAILNQYIHSSNSSSSSSSSSSNVRITFLVNIWLNHHPYNINPMSNDVMRMMQSSSSSSNINNSAMVLTMKNQPPPVSLAVTEDIIAQEDLGNAIMIPFISSDSQWGKDAEQTGIVLNMWLPRMNRSSDDNTTYHIEYASDINGCYLEYEVDEEELLQDVENDMTL